MDESAYREALKSSVPLQCPFEKSILTHCADCSKSEKHNIAEREAVACISALEQNKCTSLHELLRNNFKFALGKSHIEGPLTHAQEMRIQCGGLKGLQFIVDGNEEMSDISELLARAIKNFGKMEDVPFSQIIRYANAHWKSR